MGGCFGILTLKNTFICLGRDFGPGSLPEAGWLCGSETVILHVCIGMGGIIITITVM